MLLQCLSPFSHSLSTIGSNTIPSMLTPKIAEIPTMVSINFGISLNAICVNLTVFLRFILTNI